MRIVELLPAALGRGTESFPFCTEVDAATAANPPKCFFRPRRLLAVRPYVRQCLSRQAPGRSADAASQYEEAGEGDDLDVGAGVRRWTISRCNVDGHVLPRVGREDQVTGLRF